MLLVPVLPISVTSVSSNLPISDYPEWVAGTSYALNARILRNRRVFQSAKVGNIGIDPVAVDQDAAAPAWIEDGYANAVSCLDGVLANPTTAVRGNPISAAHIGLGVDPNLTAYVLDVPGIAGATTVTLFGVDAVRVRVIGVSASGIVVFDDSRVATGRWVVTYWEWFTKPLVGWVRSHVFRVLPLSVDRVLICLEGEAVALGEVVIGRELYVGAALAEGTSAAHKTASKFEFNEYGRLRFVQRPTRREVTYAVELTRLHFQQIEGLISDMEGGLVAAIGSPSRQTTIQFGLMGEVEWGEGEADSYTISFTVRGVA